LLEDHNNGRIYLPVEEITRCGLTVNQFGSVLHRKEWDAAKIPPKNLSQNQLYAFHHSMGEMELLEEKFLKLLRYELNRCEIYYEHSMPLFQLIHPDSRRMFGLMWNRYYMLFRKMVRNPWSVPLGRRIRLTSLQKMKLLFRWRFLPCFRLK
jgi:phytoene/squalene synthetase